MLGQRFQLDIGGLLRPQQRFVDTVQKRVEGQGSPVELVQQMRPRHRRLLSDGSSNAARCSRDSTISETTTTLSDSPSCGSLDWWAAWPRQLDDHPADPFVLALPD